MALFASILTCLAVSYSAVVVDATTSKPLAGVSVHQGGSGTQTDAQGRFTLQAAETQPVELTHVGYAPLRVLPHAGQGLAPDTLRLLPQAYVLDPVAVRPPKSLVFSSAPAEGPELDRSVLPGQAVALLVKRPAGTPADQPCLLTQVRFYLGEKVKQGRLRVRLVSIAPASGDLPERPGTADLLPTPAVFSTAELMEARRGEVHLDVSAYNLLLSAEGLCVVIEGLPTDPTDVPVSAKADPKGHVTVVVAPAAGGSPRSFSSEGFPRLVAKRETGTRTWSRMPGRPAWAIQSSLYYTVRADVDVLGY